MREIFNHFLIIQIIKNPHTNQSKPSFNLHAKYDLDMATNAMKSCPIALNIIITSLCKNFPIAISALYA